RQVDRELAAGEDRLLRFRPQPRAYPRRRRQCRGARPRSRARGPVAGQRARGGERRTRRELYRGPGTASDAAGRDHGTRHPRPRRGNRHCVDLRLLVRLREDQRGLPQSNAVMARATKKGDAMMEIASGTATPHLETYYSKRASEYERVYDKPERQ